MAGILRFYVVRPEHRMSSAPLETVGAEWASIGGRWTFIGPDIQRIQTLLGSRPVGVGLGIYSVAETAAIHAAYANASAEALATIEAEPSLDALYWAIRDTAAEAVRRGACFALEI